MSLRPLALRAEFEDGEIGHIEAWPTTTPGLVVTEPDTRTCRQARCWMLMLARHGTSLGLCWPSPEGALRAAEILGEYGDWQRTWPELKKAFKGQGPTMRAALDPTGAAPHPGSCRPPRSGTYIDNGAVA